MDTQINISFLDTREFDQGKTIRGAALVTDVKTEPLEFRCTSAIRPTQLQRILWGNRLTGYIAAQLVGEMLFKAVRNTSTLIVVRKPEFVELRPLIEIPLVQILRNEELAKASPLTLSDAQDDVVQSAGGQFEPLVLKVHRPHSDDLQAAREILGECFRSFNVLEPFERMDNALSMIHDQDLRETGG